MHDATHKAGKEMVKYIKAGGNVVADIKKKLPGQNTEIEVDGDISEGDTPLANISDEDKEANYESRRVCKYFISKN